MISLAATLAEPQGFSLVEKLLLAILTAASISLFLARFGPILKRILNSRKDPGFTLSHLGKRTWDFFWEVLCQAKVIRERPLPGVAHAFVFWGFCAFALVTLNHFASGFGLGFLDPTGVFGRFYSYLAAAFAAACAIGIFGLFVRRFFVRPRWFGEHVSYESGVIAALIFILMVTYLAAFAISPAGPAIRVNWWIHTLSILVFLPIIPHTKHLHLVLSPVTIFLSRGGFSKIPPLVGDEDFGLVAGTDLTQLVSLQSYSCVECGRCTEHCPANNTGKELNPKEIILGLRGYLNEYGPKSAENIIGKYNSMTADFQCTTCGACEYQCPVGIEHLPIIIGLRRGAVNTGAWEDDHGAKLFLALERGSNALGMPATDRDKFIQKQTLPIFDGSQEYCLWLGCMGGYDPKGREIIADFARVMNYLGTSYGVLRKEKCTGDPVRRLGNDLLFQQLAESNLETLAQNKVKKIVTICPHCVRTIQEDWKEFGKPPEIEHHSEFLARFADKLPQSNGNGRVPQVSNLRPGNGNLEQEASGHNKNLGQSDEASGHNKNLAQSDEASGHNKNLGQNDEVSGHNKNLGQSGEVSGHNKNLGQSDEVSGHNKNLGQSDEVSGHDFSRADSAPNNERALAPAPPNNKIVFHDPCYLGRYRDVYEQPRAVASLAGEVIDPPRSHQRSFCCGAGGGLAFLGEETGDRVSVTRANELIATGASTIGTACPFCNSMFRDAVSGMQQTGSAPPQVVDIAQLTARNLPASDS